MDLLDHTPGAVTASSALIVDANSKLNILNVDNLILNGNAITSATGDITVTPSGVGNIVLDGQKWPQADGDASTYLKTDGSGQLSWGALPSHSFTISDGASTDTFSTGETLLFTAGTGITTSVTDNQVTISHADTSSAASVTNTGSTYIQSITVDTFGHITALASSAVPASSDVDVSTANLTSRLAQLGNVTIGNGTSTTVTTSGPLIVTGNLTVNGTTTSVNTETINLADNIISLNSNYSGSAPTEDAGIEVTRGSLANSLIKWNESTDRWGFTNNGTTYYNFPLSTEYDKYTSWTVSDGVNSEAISSGNTLTFDGSYMSYTAATNTVSITNIDGGTF